MKVLKFNEAKLNLQELEKDSPKGEGKRGDVLVSKIENEEELKAKSKNIVVQNKEEVIGSITNDDGYYDNDKAKDFFLKVNTTRYRDAIEGDDGNNYKLNDIEKTSDFGSSKGSGLGTVDTRYVEAIQCLFFAYRQKKGEALENFDVEKLINLSDRTFERIKRYVDIGDIVITKEIIGRFAEKWKSTFVNIANVIYEPGSVNSGFKNDLLINPRKRYKFCQISTNEGVVKAVKDTFSKYEKVSMAKWNPSDVWAVDMASESLILNSIINCSNLEELNNLINTLFDEKKLIGVSLKKVLNKEVVKLIVNKLTKIPRYKFQSVRVAEDSLSTIGIKISAHRYSEEFGEATEYMTVRAFAGPNKIQNISGEVEGKAARHGKISLTKINKILDDLKIETVPSATRENYYEESLSTWSDEELINEIESINRKIIRKYKNVTIPTSKEATLTRSRLISKYQSLFLSWILMENQDRTYNQLYSYSDKIIGMMFQYALSINLTGKKSGRTPKYARIVD